MAAEPLFDVVIPVHIATRYEADKLAHILTHDDKPPILAVMTSPAENGSRWILTVSIGVYAPDSISAIIRAARYVRRACRSLGFGAWLAEAGVSAGPSQLFEPPGPR